MTKWTSIALALVVLAAVAANASPVAVGASHKVMGRQGDAAPSAEVVTNAPAAAAPAAAAASEEEDDDDDDEYDIEDAFDDDDDDEEEEDEAEDDDEDDDEDYLDRFFDDILADDDDDDDDDEPTKPKPSKAPATVTSAPTATADTGIKATPKPTTAAAEDDDDDDDDSDEDYDTAGAGSTNNEVKKPGEGGLEDYLGDDDDEEEGAEKDETDDDDKEEDYGVSADDDDEEDDDDEDDLASKRSRALKGEEIPAAHLVKYNGFVDTIMEKINEVLKKTFDPVSIKLTRGSPVPPSRKPTKSDPKEQTLENVSDIGPAYEVVDLTQESLESGAPLTRTKRVRSQRTRTLGGGNRKKNKNKNQLRAQRAHATLIGLSSVRRDGDVTVTNYADHSTIKSNFLIGPLVLKVEKAFGRGAKKELRSATATTDKMGGRLVLRVNQTGVASLHTIRVLQPKQVRVESDDDHEQTREFVWKRSSHIARLVSQKLTKAARELLGTKKNPVKQD